MDKSIKPVAYYLEPADLYVYRKVDLNPTGRWRVETDENGEKYLYLEHQYKWLWKTCYKWVSFNAVHFHETVETFDCTR